ncbi:heterokaryon incompatibility protein-domain-containing protein [Bisporella sp. PMI_857]|nr:heterokaryon incompatibility protein-domain-containing protein [Bisporella sp. PMI_857]
MWFLLIILLLISIWYPRLFHGSRREDESPRARQTTVDRYNPEQIPATPEPRLRRALCGGVSSRDICEVCRTVDIGLLFCDEPRVVFEPEEELDGVFAEWDIDTIRTETRRARCCRLCYLLQYVLDHGFDTARGIIKISRFIRGGHSIQRIEVVVNDEEGAKTPCRHLSDTAIVSVDSYPAALLYKTWEKLQREIDFDLASFWIDACHKEHGATCQPPRELMLSLRRSSKLLSRLGDKLVTRAGGLYINKDLNKDGLNPPLRLIDVQKMCIVMAETPPAFWFRHDKREPVPMYVTLSYVWGSIEENRESPKLVKGKVISWSKRGALKREPLPKTVMDAIQCTKRLGVGYLWVDRLCIVQDDLPERDATMKVMDSIYMRAYCTVIAVSAKNCYGGIRGVGGASLPWKLEQDRPPRKVTIRGISLISVRKNPLAELWESTWKTRGWTFQEKFLSPRSLLMMDSSAVFWCSKTMQCQDSLGWFKVPEELDMYDSTMLRSTLSSMGPLSTSSAGKLGVQLLSLEEAAAESRDTAATLRRARRQYCDFLEGALTGIWADNSALKQTICRPSPESWDT